MITIVSGNLNQYGNAGQFETDRSTWGFSDSAAGSTVVRSGVQKTSGLSSALLTKSLGSGNSLLIPYAFPATIGKTYVIKSKVFVHATTPVGLDTDVLTFAASLDNFMFGLTEIDRVDKTVLQAKGSWQDVEIYVEATSSSFALYYSGSLRLSGTGIDNGQMYVDQLEIYEYTGEPDGGTPPPPGIVQFDNPSFDSSMAPWENINPSNNEPFVWDAGNSVIADGTISGKDRSGYVAGITDNAGPWPVGDYVVEIIAENLSAGGLNILPKNEIVRLYGAQNNLETPTLISTPSVVFDRTAGDQTKVLTFTLDQTWTYLAFVFSKNGVPGGGSEIKINVKSITVIDGPVPSEIEEPGEVEVDNVFLSKNPITLGASAVGGWEALTNYRIYNEVRVEDVADSGVFNTKFQVDLAPAVAGTVTFYLNEAFRDSFKFIPPELNASTIIRLTDRIKRFKNYSGDLQDTEVIPGSLTPGEVNLVVYGGIDKYNYPGLNFLTDYLTANKKFMTWAPVEKYVDRQQEDYLNFFVYANTIGDLKLQIKAYFDDNTNETAVVTTLAGVLYRGLYQIPAGPANCGVALINPAKNLTHYELTLLNQADLVISETRTYYIADERHPLTRFFMFLNSLGAFEVLRFTGQAEEETEFARETVQKFLPYNYDQLDGEFAINSTIMQSKNNYSSGYIKGRMAAAWHEYMKDFLLSTRVYDVTNGDRIPVVISGGTHSKQDQTYNRFIRFEGKAAYDNTSFTPSGL